MAAAQALAAPPEVLARIRAQAAPAEADNDFIIWPENADTWHAFRALDTQWRIFIPPMGGRPTYLGLRQEAIETTLRLLGYRRPQTEIFHGLKVMERAVIDHLNG